MDTSLLSFAVCGYYFVSQYFAIALFAVFLALLVEFYVAAASQLHAIQTFLSAATTGGEGEIPLLPREAATLFALIRILRMIRLVVSVYVVLYVVIVVMLQFAARSVSQVGVLLGEAADLMLIVSVGFLIRLRCCVGEGEREGEVETAAEGESEEEEDDDDDARMRGGGVFPARCGAESVLLVVQNPPSAAAPLPSSSSSSAFFVESVVFGRVAKDNSEEANVAVDSSIAGHSAAAESPALPNTAAAAQ